MAIGVGTLLEISLGMIADGQSAMNVYQYEVTVSPSTKSAAEVAEAWWNHVKTNYRALAVSGGGRQFDKVVVRELNNPTGELAEFSVPAGEQDGTRAAGSLGPYLPTANAVGVRLTVGTRATRPGQKRIPFLTEGDVTGNPVGATFIGLTEALMGTMTGTITLGDPAEFVVLDPIITRKDATGAVTAHQPVTGFIVNPYVSSQVSRKYGRGI